MLRGFRTIFSAIAFLLCLSASAQYYTLGNDPIGQKWNIIKTDHYKLIYPREQDSLARLYLWNLETKRGEVYNPLRIDPKRIPVIMHAHTTVSNGVVTWAPKRIDMITCPDAYSSESDPWMSHLVTHEMRHVGQVEHFTRGIYNVFYYPLGEQVTGLGLALMLSKPFMEGDAVIAETELSNGGRGRNADFAKLMRTLYINDDFRTWDRLRFGSKRQYAPNVYEFGYNYLGYLRYITGRYDLTGDYFEFPVKYWYNIPLLAENEPFIVGFHQKDLFHRSQKTLSAMWKEDDRSRGEFTPYETLRRKDDKLYTEITSPIYIDVPQSKYYGSTIAVKWGMETTYKLVAIDSTGKERFISFFNPIASRLVYDGHGKIYWTETVSADAVDLKDFSEIHSFDVITGKSDRITKKTKYFNPAVSPDGQTIAVAEYPVTGSSYLVLLNTEGEIISRIEAPLKAQIKEPVYVGESLMASVIMPDGNGLYELKDGQWTEVIKPHHRSMSGLRGIGDKLYFSSDLDGVLNIYTYDITSRELIRITNSRFGADYAYIDPRNSRLYYSEYGILGYRAAYSEKADRDTTVKSFDVPYRFPLAEIMSGQTASAFEKNGVAARTKALEDTLNTFDTEKYPARKYNKFLNTFHIHSWFPFYVNIDKILSFSFEHITHAASLGATVLSQNRLGTTVSSLSYGYIKDTYTGKYFHSGHFKLDTRIVGNISMLVQFDINNRNSFLHTTDGLYEYPDKPLVATSAMLYYPLAFNSNGWYRALTPQVSYSFSTDKYLHYKSTETSYSQTMMYGITYAQVIPTAGAQIYPRWGFGASAIGSSTIATGDLFGPLMYLHAYSYFPGITRQQGLKVSVSYQHQFVDGKTYYRSYASMPRGYTRTPEGNLLLPLEQYFIATADYAIPIPLGDFSLGPILYVQRLQLIPFADYAINRSPKSYQDYFSYGCDVLVDFYIFRFDVPISAGFRYTHTNPRLNIQEHNFEFLFSVDI